MSKPEKADRSLTRRQLLRYSGAAVAGIACSAALGPLAEALPRVPVGSALSPQREATLAAILEALGTVAPDIDPIRAGEALTTLASRYEEDPPEVRRGTELLLDTVEADLPSGTFKGMPPSARVAVLRAGISGRGDSRYGIPKHASSERSLLVTHAVTFAAGPFARPDRPSIIDQVMSA
jgi:hypothetical protein